MSSEGSTKSNEDEEGHQDTLLLSASQQKLRFLRGRPPWYDEESGSVRRPFVMGVAGGTGSGKTSVVKKIVDALSVNWVTMLSMDSFYRGLTRAESADAANYNFDHPDAIDFDAVVDTLGALMEGKSAHVPIYCFETHSRLPRTRMVYGADVIIVEGILALYDARLRSLYDMKLFVDTDSDTRLARRLRRDVAERGRSVRGILEQYTRFVKPAYDDYVGPTKGHADVVVPRGADNIVAIGLISRHVQNVLEERGYVAPDPRERLETLGASFPAKAHVMPPTNQTRALHAIIRDRDTGRDDFCFYAHRLIRMVVEYALGFLPSRARQVVTPTGATFGGVVNAARLCAVSVMRAGEAMEPAVREVCNKIRIGKLLIQSHNKKPRLYYCRLPRDIGDRHVLLLDPMLATGAAVKMAIRVLLDHGVAEERIIFLCLIASVPGLQSVSYTYPNVTICTSEVDQLDDNFYLSPGCGNFGYRFFVG
jgi:uridine kinase